MLAQLSLKYRKEIIFTRFSLAGFTTISSKLTPEKVSSMLDRLYMQFDSLSVVNGVFKVQ